MIDTVEELCKRLKPVFGSKIERLWFAYLAEDSEGKREIENVLQILNARTLNQDGSENILLNPPPKEVVNGEYPIGMVIYNEKILYPFGLREDELCQHIGIFGRSGAGKTNAGFILVENLLKKGKPVLILDWKRNYRDLLAYVKDHDFLVFTVGRNISPFQFNPLIPPAGTQPTTWLKKIIEIMAGAFYVGEGVIYLMQKAIDAVYKEFGIYRGKIEQYPTMRDILERLKEYKAKGREINWLASTLRTVASLCFGEMGKVINVRNHIGIEELLKKNVIMELDALTNTDKTFFIEALLLWIHHYRLAEGDREQFKHCILVEEAHHLFMKREAIKERTTETIMREIRELGESIVIITQHPSLISIPALGNTYCTLTFNLKHKADVSTAANYMLLESESKKYLGKLPVGYATVKLQGRWFEPFLIKIPLVRVQKGLVTDKAIKAKMGGYFTYSQPVEAKEGDLGGISAAHKSGMGEDITDIEKGFIIDIINNPYSGVTKRYKKLNISTKKGNVIKKLLIKRGIIKTKQIISGNGWIVLIGLTKKGKDIARTLGCKLKKLNGKAGFEHEYWRYRVGKYYEKRGYKVRMEKRINGEADIVAEKGEQRIAVEIETGGHNIPRTISNIEKDLKADFTMVISVATSKSVEEKIRGQLREKGLDRIKKVKVTSVMAFE
jgi:hypothetical protein